MISSAQYLIPCNRKQLHKIIMTFSPSVIIIRTKYTGLKAKIKVRNTLPAEDVYTETPNYPKILDLSPRSKLERQKEDFYRRFRNLNTVEEKLIALNINRYWGWPMYHLNEECIPYNYLPFVQCVTRTELSEVDRIPPFLQKDSSAYLPLIKQQLEQVLSYEHFGKKNRYIIDKNEADLSEAEISDLKSRNIIQQLNRVIQSNLSFKYPHLLRAQVDYEPRLESFWRVGGFYPTEEDKKLRKSKELDETLLDDIIDRNMAYFGKPALHLRSRLPLRPFPQETAMSLVDDSQDKALDQSNVLVGSGGEMGNASSEVAESAVSSDVSDISDASSAPQSRIYSIPEWRYNPDVYLGIKRERGVAVIMPGFWPGDPYRFGLLSYLTRSHMLERPSTFGTDDNKEALHCQAILSSYAWVYNQACYQGFSTFNDLTYPLASQTVITDGKLFSFYAYQLNTMVLHSNLTDSSNPLKNVCYATTERELYHDIRDGKVIGWNDEVLSDLLSMYLNVPAKRQDVEMNPYLNAKEKLIADIEDAQRREWFHMKLHYMFSRRPHHRLPPEIYDWERIYKIDFEKRPMDAKIRFWELGLDPINDTTWNPDVVREYIRKADRGENPKKKPRYHKTHYPNAYQDYKDVV